MQSFLAQSFYIPKPALTEANCPDQTGRVFIITGGYAGCGKELAKLLYEQNATLYIAGRSEAKANAAISSIKTALPASRGTLAFMNIDLSDLATIKPSVDAFLAHAARLDVLVNNAGVMFPPAGSLDAHGLELQLGTNCVGHFLLHRLLQPLLARTAAASPPGSVRVSWAASVGVDLLAPKPGGMLLDAATGKPVPLGTRPDYGASKVGNIFFARHFARDTPASGIVHVAFNPGNLQTELQRHGSRMEKIVAPLLLHPAVYGGYTELFTAVSPEVTPERSGAYVYPWGRFGGFREDIETAIKTEEEGGTGMADRFVAWCEAQTKPFS